jgi:hypothetical protein
VWWKQSGTDEAEPDLRVRSGDDRAGFTRIASTSQGEVQIESGLGLRSGEEGKAMNNDALAIAINNLAAALHPIAAVDERREDRLSGKSPKRLPQERRRPHRPVVPVLREEDDSISM